MSDETVRQALTPEEWAQLECYREKATTSGTRATVFQGSLFVEWGNPDYGSVKADGAGRHALAALALHGQPFGFTREDVELLRNSSERYYELLMERGADTPHFARKQAFMLRSLADRIAALLPPVTPHP